MEIFLSTVLLLFATSAFGQVQADFPSTDLETFRPPALEDALSDKSSLHLSTHPSGAIGLFHTYSALTQPAGPYAFGLYFARNQYSAKSFPASTPKYEIKRAETNFGLSYTPANVIEIFLNYGLLNVNDAPPTNPKYTQSGNFGFGAKLSYPFTENLSAAGIYHIEKRSSIPEIPNSQFALNHELRAALTYEASSHFRYNFNLGLRVDNNLRLTAGKINNQRQVTIFNVYATQVVPIALSAEYLFQKWLTLSAEYSADFVTNSALGFSDQPQRFTFGSRIFPLKNDKLGLQLAVDLGTSKTDLKDVVKEPPFSFWFGASYLFSQNKNHKAAKDDSFKEEEFIKPTTKQKSIQIIEENKKGNRITGYITNIETGDPVASAKIYLCDDETNPIVTDLTGRYRSNPIPIGQCEIRLEHPNYRTSTEIVQVSGDTEQSFDFGLLQQSKEMGALLVRVKDSEGNPTESVISFPENPDIQSVNTNEFGLIKIKLPPGRYAVRAQSKNLKAQTNNVDLNPKQDLFVDFALQPGKTSKQGTVTTAKPTASTSPKALIKISKDRRTLDVSQKIQFELGQAVLAQSSTRLLDDISKFLKRHPEIKKIQIGGHTDNTGDAVKNMKLSTDRAAAVKMYLLKTGLDNKLLESKGYGQTKPIADNTTTEGRNQNRRVEFKIVTVTSPSSGNKK